MKFKKTSKDLGSGAGRKFMPRKKRKLPFGTKPDDEYNSMISWNVARKEGYRKEGYGKWKRRNDDDDEEGLRYVP